MSVASGFDFRLMAAAFFLEAVFGYPDALFRIAGHPVTWIGAGIAWLDRRWNSPPVAEVRGRAVGAMGLAILLVLTGASAAALDIALRRLLPPGAALVVLGLLASSLIAQRSLARHVRAVETGLRTGLLEGREAVSHIVGRDLAALDEAGVARAAIESLAENFSDGVVAPVLWGVLLGLPGIALYKAINTADSMIGHRTPRHQAFGWAAARVDDVVNLPASRLAALLLVAAAAIAQAAPGRALRAVWRDAGHHRSPNAGWPEAAMAGALGLRLAGPRVYGEVRVEDAWMGDGRAEAGADDIAAALFLYRRACMIGALLVLAGAILTWRGGGL